MSVVQQVRQFLRGESEGDEQPAIQPAERVRLFRCHTCGETYISTRMEHCPSCETSVEHIPSERDLGFV